MGVMAAKGQTKVGVPRLKGDEGGSGAGHDGRSLTKGGMLSNKVGVPRFSTVLTPFMLHGL